METQIRFLGQEDPLEKEMATHSSTLAWRIPWTEEPGGLQSVGSQRVGHELETKQQQQWRSSRWKQCWFTTKPEQGWESSRPKSSCVPLSKSRAPDLWDSVLPCFQWEAGLGDPARWQSCPEHPLSYGLWPRASLGSLLLGGKQVQTASQWRNRGHRADGSNDRSESPSQNHGCLRKFPLKHPDRPEGRNAWFCSRPQKDASSWKY